MDDNEATNPETAEDKEATNPGTSDDNEATNSDAADDFFPAPKFKFKPRSFADIANSFADNSSTAVTQSDSDGLAGADPPGSGGPSISFVSLDKKNIGQLKLPDNIRMLEEAKAKQARGAQAGPPGGGGLGDDLASNSISSSSDSKASAVKATPTASQSATSSNGNGEHSGPSPPAGGAGLVLFGQNFTDRVSSQADGFKSSSDLISFSDISNSDNAKDKDAGGAVSDPSVTNSDPAPEGPSGSSSSTGAPTTTNYFSNCHDGDGFGFLNDGPATDKDDDGPGGAGAGGPKGLKRTFEVISGEEDEETVMTVPGSLYVWDSDKSNWIGKGKGNFRLNDSKEMGAGAYSRLIVRSLGVHKVLLNARLVAGMNVNLANETSIRFATVEGLHLFKGKRRLDDLLELINTRIEAMNKRRKEEESSEAEAV